MNISHVMLGVSNLEKSLDFYRDTLGLVVKKQLPGFVFLDAGGVTLGLSKDIWTHLGKAAGASQVVFAVESVKASYEDLKAKGLEFMGEPRNADGTNWAANFRDPDGHLLSIFGPEA
jgi:catechol 2,3-dioxygenase-like lactoylglutathione lyase family enzyme